MVRSPATDSLGSNRTRGLFGAALLLALLAGCASSGSAMPSANVAPLVDVERCQAAGHEPASASFSACLQTLELQRRQEALRDQEINNATINSQRRIPLPR
jgi:hypothetical protein